MKINKISMQYSTKVCVFSKTAPNSTTQNYSNINTKVLSAQSQQSQIHLYNYSEYISKFKVTIICRFIKETIFNF